MKYKIISALLIIIVITIAGVTLYKWRSKTNISNIVITKDAISQVGDVHGTKSDITQNWPFTYNQYGKYVISTKGSTASIKEGFNGPVVRTIEMEKEVLKEKGGGVEQVAFDTENNQLYVLVSHTAHADPITGTWFIYEHDIQNGTTRELYKGNNIVIPTLRIAPDHSSVSVMSYTVDDRDQNHIAKRFFTIAEFAENGKKVTFEVPGDVDSFAKKNKRDVAIIERIVGAYQFVNDTALVFSAYFAEGSEVDGYTQISDKELWSYDIATGKLTLLETISFEQ